MIYYIKYNLIIKQSIIFGNRFINTNFFLILITVHIMEIKFFEKLLELFYNIKSIEEKVNQLKVWEY